MEIALRVKAVTGTLSVIQHAQLDVRTRSAIKPRATARRVTAVIGERSVNRSVLRDVRT